MVLSNKRLLGIQPKWMRMLRGTFEQMVKWHDVNLLSSTWKRNSGKMHVTMLIGYTTEYPKSIDFKRAIDIT